MSQLPEIRVDSVRKIFDDGNHNAFTDMCRFRGNMYLAFRSSPDGHMIFTSSRIVVLTSKDGAEWRKLHSFSVPLRDVRDSHFLIFQDKLFIYTGTWLCNPATPGIFDINDHLGYAAWTSDGEHWEGPRSLEGTYGHYIWRAGTHGGKAYLCGRAAIPSGIPNARYAVKPTLKPHCWPTMKPSFSWMSETNWWKRTGPSAAM